MITTTDYELLSTSAGLVDRSDRGKLLLRGSEAADYLQGQVTNDVEALEAGQGCYAALLSHKGKIQADMRVLRGPDWLWLDTEPGALPAILRNAQTYGIGRDLHVEDVTGSRALLSLLGPAARDALDAAPADSEHAWIEGEHGVYVTTDLGVDVICPTGDAEAVRTALGVEQVSGESAECLRVESGRPRFGVDMDTDTIPEEAGLNDRAVSFTKGCYVGQETVARLHYKGKPNRHLRGLRLAEPAEHGAVLRLGDREVGRVGSATVSPSLGPVALAIVRREAESGETVLVGEPGSPGQVVELPFAGPGQEL
jgi:folate-binding protein YgfZ